MYRGVLYPGVYRVYYTPRVYRATYTPRVYRATAQRLSLSLGKKEKPLRIESLSSLLFLKDRVIP